MRVMFTRKCSTLKVMYEEKKGVLVELKFECVSFIYTARVTHTERGKNQYQANTIKKKKRREREGGNEL